jgi:O-antigen/teichoic acid export membrane protein
MTGSWQRESTTRTDALTQQDDSVAPPVAQRADPITWLSVSRLASQSAERMGVTSSRVISASWSFVIRAAGMVIAFGVQTLLARAIGRDGYGGYVYLMACMNIVVSFAMLEYETSGIRFVGTYVGTQQWGLLRGFLRETQSLVFAISLVLGLVGAVGIVILHDSMKPLLYSAGLWTCLLLPPTALLTVQSGYLQGFHRMVAAQAPLQVLRPVLFGGLVLYLVRTMGNQPLHTWHAVVGNLVATLITLGISTIYLRRSTPIEATRATPESNLKLWLYTAHGMMIIAVAQMVLGPQVDVVVVGSMLGARGAALYGTASQIGVLVSFAAGAITLVAIPEVATLYAQGRMRDLQRLLHLMLAGTTAVTVPAVVVVLMLGHWLLGLYGPAFQDAYPLLVIISINQAVIGVVGIMSGYVLTMTGHEKDAAVIISVCAVLNLVLSVVLTRLMDSAAGAAVATLLATTLRSAALAVFARRKLKLDLLPVGWIPGLLPAGDHQR